MNRILYILILLCISAQILAQTAVTTANLNLRESPNTWADVELVIPRGNEVEVIDCENDWCHVTYNNLFSGYVSKRFINNKKESQRRIKYYINSFGEKVQSPTNYSQVPSNATAICRDGTYSFSRNRRGTCSHHGGVKKWF
ncbi:MAG: DUF3761 domain-containing protein [Chitinophagales bacterium]